MQRVMANGTGVLLVGTGSIGVRHRRVLQALGCGVKSVSRRGAGDFLDLCTALRDRRYDLLVIATETARHATDWHAAVAAGYRGAVVVEKPACLARQELGEVSLLAPAWTAYNLRFHPVSVELKRRLRALREPVLCAHLYAGQDLREWRPGRPVRDTYSARSGSGGGVLYDLSHELDLARWLFGPIDELCASGGRFGTMTLDADDCWSILLRSRDCRQITVNLNYFDRPGRRFIHVNTGNVTIHADLVTGVLMQNGETASMSVTRDCSYRAMWNAVLATLGGTPNSDLCPLDEGLVAVDAIAACRESVDRNAWVRV